ncbi:protein NRT1/ PTR FAMILY 1.2-like [Helianthus annuus]|nr:protein NRT1/ PTR FAMILY 1.2-like [Helianthus annuus]
MSSLAMVMFMVSMAAASLVSSLLTNIVDSDTSQGGDVSWLSSDIDEGHVDYYYWLLSFLTFLNFVYYLICYRVHQSFSSSEIQNRKITSRFEIPAASFSLFMLLTITIWIPFYGRVMVPFLAKFTHGPRGLNLKARMGVGIILSIITMVVSAIVETIRHDLANLNTTGVMSAMWLVPRFVLLGLTEAFNAIGQLEFYYSELPNSISSLAMVMFMVSVAVASLVASLLTNIVDSVTGQGGGVSWLRVILTRDTWITVIGCLVS